MKEAKIDNEYYVHQARLEKFYALPKAMQTVTMYEKLIHTPKRKLRVVK